MARNALFFPKTISTAGVTLLPLYAQTMLIPSVVARPLQGEPPTIDLLMGYNKSNIAQAIVSRADELVAGVQKQSSLKYVQAR